MAGRPVRIDSVLAAVLEKHGVNYPVAMKTEVVVHAFEEVIGRIRTIPTTLLVDSEGRIRAVHRGFADPETFEKEIEALLPKAEEKKVVLVVEGMT